MNIIFAGSYFYNKKNINKSIDGLSKLFGIKENYILVELKTLFIRH